MSFDLIQAGHEARRRAALGKHLPHAQGGIFYVLFSLDYSKGESN